MNSFPAEFDPIAIHTKYDTQGQGVKVAVLDTGINLAHAELKNRIVSIRDLCNPANGDGLDADGHGTQLAGLIAEVAPQCQLLVGRIMLQSGFFIYDVLCDGIKWALQQGADIICVASGQQTGDPDAERWAQRAVDQYNALIVCAAGNSGEHSDQAGCFLARTRPCLAVGALDQQGQIASFSDQNPAIGMVYAPGVDLIVPDLDGYVITSGTSLSAAYASGALALLISLLKRRNGTFRAAEGLEKIRSVPHAESKGQPFLPLRPEALFRAFEEQ